MPYDENLLVELIADSELTHGDIAERVGVSRRTVWLIANGRSRPDLQQQIADTVEGYRQAAIRLAAKHMRALLEKQIQLWPGLRRSNRYSPSFPRKRWTITTNHWPL